MGSNQRQMGEEGHRNFTVVPPLEILWPRFNSIVLGGASFF